MYVDAILCKPINFDFGEGYGETWDIVYPDVSDWTVEQCHDYLHDYGGDMPAFNPYEMNREELTETLESISIQVHDDENDEVLRQAVVANIDDETLDGIEDWQASVQDSMQDNPDMFSPMMNYYYPLPNFNKDIAKAQATLMSGGAVAIAMVNDEPVMVLTGGGMDLSWDICEGYILLNYYPPFHFTDLPEFAGQELSPRNQKILDACIECAEILNKWTTRRIEELNKYKSKLAKKD